MQQKTQKADIWSSLLSDFSSSSQPSKFLHKKSVVVFGDELTGKSTLATKLCCHGIGDKERAHHGNGLDYHELVVKGDDDDESTTCNVWVTDGHLSHRNLVKFSLKPETLEHTLVLLVVDMSQPWTAMESLDKWTGVIREHLDSLKLDPEEQKRLKDKILSGYQSYVEPGQENEAAKVSNVQQATHDSLDESTLTDNLMLQIVVVATKCDHLETLESQHGYGEEQFDCVQYHLRKYCMKVGAGLVYTSAVKEDKNVEVLRRYITHKLYGFKFDKAASVVDRESVFVPSGWDSEKKVKVLAESFANQISPDHEYSQVICKPVVQRKLVAELKELVVDDEQTFLHKCMNYLLQAKPDKGRTSLAGGDNPLNKKPSSIHNSPVMKSRDSLSSIGSTGGKSSVKGGDGKQPSNERMLANFFNSLLQKKGPQAGGSPQQATPPKKQVNKE